MRVSIMAVWSATAQPGSTPGPGDEIVVVTWLQWR